jgi:glycosyltransferase involved in cell wall biosynthesis
MRIFVVCDHEPLPTDPGDRRLMRAGMLTAALARAGHDVTWFTSSFDHYRKRQRGGKDVTLLVDPRLTIRVLASPGYRSNIDVLRIIHNAIFARAFARAARAETTPELVIAAIPATDSAAAAVRYAKQRGIASIVDVYDPWPDSFRYVLPRAQLALGAPVIALLNGQARFACKHASSLVAISEGYLRWGQKKGGRDAAHANDRVFPLSYMPQLDADGAERRAVLARLGIEPHHRVVSFAGTWGATHDFAPVIAAAAGLTDRPEIRFVLAGDPGARPDARAAFEQLGNVCLPGWLDSRELAVLLSASDVGLLPYRAHAPQTLPNKIFEYMAYGAFQIGTLRGEVEAVYRQTGAGRSIAQTGEALAAALREFLVRDQPGARSLRMEAFQKHFAAPTVYGDMVAHIEKIATAH